MKNPDNFPQDFGEEQPDERKELIKELEISLSIYDEKIKNFEEARKFWEEKIKETEEQEELLSKKLISYLNNPDIPHIDSILSHLEKMAENKLFGSTFPKIASKISDRISELRPDATEEDQASLNALKSRSASVAELLESIGIEQEEMYNTKIQEIEDAGDDPEILRKDFPEFQHINNPSNLQKILLSLIDNNIEQLIQKLTKTETDLRKLRENK